MAYATSTVIAIAAIASAAAGTGVGVYTSLEQGAAAEKAAKFNEAVARNNALAAEMEAQSAAAEVRTRNRRLMAKQRTALLKSGVLLTGSAEDVLYDSALQGELTALNATYSGGVQATNSRSQATLARMQGKNAARTGTNQAIGHGISGAGSALSIAANYPGFRQD